MSDRTKERSAAGAATTDGDRPRLPSPRPLSPKPQAGGFRLESEGAPTRKFSCTHYDECLDHAVDEGWVSWTCEGCEAFEEAPSDRLAHDVAGLLQIWSEATGESVIDGPGGTGMRPRTTVRGTPR